MYHRFEENKYPSTNIKINIFKKHLDIIRENNLSFLNPKNFELEFNKVSREKKILLTIDDAFSSFYLNAWPILKRNKIPFILFVSTESVGKNGYMNWNEIIEISKEDFVFIGNHSHSHEYLVKYKFEEFKKDIEKSIKIFKENIGYNSVFFSYPFGEYSLEQKKYITKKFDYAFGQHSGVIDLNKDKYELPRFPINEKYGDLERFKFLINLLPIQYKAIIPEEKFLLDNNNQPKIMKPKDKNVRIVKRVGDKSAGKSSASDKGSSKNTPAYHAEQAQLFAMSALTHIERNNSTKATWNSIRAQNAIVSARHLITEIQKENRFESDHFAKNLSIIGKTKSEAKSDLIELIDAYEELLLDHDRYGAFRRLAAKKWGRPAIKITIQEVNEITKLVHEAYALNPERVDRSKSQE